MRQAANNTEILYKGRTGKGSGLKEQIFNSCEIPEYFNHIAIG